MDESAVTRYIVATFADVETIEAMGYTFFFYGAERKLPFATLATADNPYDNVSQLDRPSVFRLNIGVSADTYSGLFGARPTRTGADGVVVTGHDFSGLDQLMPHPVYAPQAWICVLNPADATFQHTVQPLLAEAYAIAVKRQAKARPSKVS